MGFVAGKYRTDTGVEQRALFQQAYRFGDHIQRALPRLQHPLAGFYYRRERLNVAPLLFLTELCAGNRPCAAVDCDDCIPHLLHLYTRNYRFFYKYHYCCRNFR